MARMRARLCCIVIRGLGTEACPLETISAGPASAYCRSRQLLRHCSAALLVAIKLAGLSKFIVGESAMLFLLLAYSVGEPLVDNSSELYLDEFCCKDTTGVI